MNSNRIQFEDKHVIRVGSRKSELALIQTKYVISRLQNIFKEEKFEIHTMSTIGDRVLNVSLPKIGEKSLFTRDLEDALRNGGVDFVVHSLKDLPTVLPAGMAIGAVLEREDARDALVLNETFKGATISTLPTGSVIGTSSLRRTAQIRRKYPHLVVTDIRGNLNTRLAKLDALGSKYAGIILAQAGLIRMGWKSRISQTLEPTELLYAVGQGALAVECRINDTRTLSMLKYLMCLKTLCKILAERSFLKTLGGGCSAPVAVCSSLKVFSPGTIQSLPAGIKLTGAVWSLDGTTEIRNVLSCSLALDKEVQLKRVNSENNGPLEKRPRKQTFSNLVNESPAVINDNTGIEVISNVSNIQQLVDIHGEILTRCPYGAKKMNNYENKNNKDKCPLKVPVGQDFMGVCPYVSTEAKVSLAMEVLPSSGNVNGCIAAKSDFGFPCTSKNLIPSASKLHCPFFQETVQMFDYPDDKKPKSNELLPILVDDLSNVFCGIYRHKCYNDDYFIKSCKLGQTLAENLICKGALKVMKSAQTEIHSKP